MDLMSPYKCVWFIFSTSTCQKVQFYIVFFLGVIQDPAGFGDIYLRLHNKLTANGL